MKYTRKKHGRGFSYLDQSLRRLDSRNATDRATRDWIKSLAIPPAWTRVRINNDLAAKVFASGRDANGKKQYIYNPAWRAKRNQQKFERIERFANGLENLREQTAEHLENFTEHEGNRKALNRETVLACMVRLLDSAYFRPGNSQYTQQNETFGLTTLRSKHLCIHEHELTFDYAGKSGVQQNKTVASEQLSRIVAELDEQPGYRIFKYYADGQKVYVNSDDLNDYIREIMGEEFSAKDFRTWAGTVITASALAKSSDPAPDTEDERKKIIRMALTEASDKLGNTPAICQENYVDPRLLEAYLDGVSISDFFAPQGEVEEPGLSREELATLDLLESRS